MSRFQLTIHINEATDRLIELIERELHHQSEQVEQQASVQALSKKEIKSAISKGALWLTRANSTRRLRRVKASLQPKDKLSFYYNPDVLNSTTEPAQLIEDFGDYSVWYKPYGMLCQGSKWSDHCTINRFIEVNDSLKRPAFIVHRLDRAATGLIIIAHKKSVAKALSQMFEQRQLAKYYQIIVHGHAELEEYVVDSDIDDKPAKSTFSLLSYQSAFDMSLLLVKIDSGRKHQIRKHAASIGFPVVGDRLHGDPLKDANFNRDLQLCAVKLSFTCPITSKIQLIELPAILRPQLQ